MATSEQNKHTVTRVFEAFRAGDIDAFDEIIVDDYIQHNPQAGNGLQAVKAFFGCDRPGRRRGAPSDRRR